LLFWMRRPPRCAHFPYTTLFRSVLGGHRKGLASPHSTCPARLHKCRAQSGCTSRGRIVMLRPPFFSGPQPEPSTPMATHKVGGEDRKSTRLNSSHVKISYAVFCL